MDFILHARCQCKPAKAISIIEADVNVDFAPPKDYQDSGREVESSDCAFQSDS